MNELRQRLVTGIALFALFSASLYMGPIPLILFFSIICLFGIKEWIEVIGSTNINGYTLYGFIAYIAILGFTFGSFGLSPKTILVSAMILNILFALDIFSKQMFSTFLIFPGILYVLLSMHCLNITVILWPENYQSIILALFILVASSDIGAYFIGKQFGKNKLAPNISPGKTWEGFFGGLFLNILFSLGLAFVLDNYNWVLIGIVVHICSVIGDLCMSAVKRRFNKKDTGTTLPGHGGILDRIDGVLFFIPFSIYLLTILINHNT